MHELIQTAVSRGIDRMLKLHTIMLLLLLRCVWRVHTLTLECYEETNDDITLTCKDGLNPVEATFSHGEMTVATDTSSYTFSINSTTEGEYTCSISDRITSNIVLISKYDHMLSSTVSYLCRAQDEQCHTSSHDHKVWKDKNYRLSPTSC